MDISTRSRKTTCPGALLSVLDELPSAILLIDGEGGILFANRTAQEFFGVQQDNAVGMHVRAFAEEYIAPQIAEEEDASVLHRICNPAGYTFSQEFLIKERGGVLRKVEYTRRTIESGDLCGTRIDTFRSGEEVTDATDRPGRDTLLSMLRHAPYGVALIEPDGAWTYTNDTFTAMTGYTHEEIQTLDGWLSRAHPNPSYRNRVIEIWMEDLIRSGITSSFSVVCRDGRVREIEIRPTTISSGRLLLTFLDVTERTIMEERLQQTTAELSAVIDAFPDLFLRVSFDGTVLDGRAGRYAHPAIEHQQYLGRRLQDIFEGDLGRHFRESVLSVCTGGVPQYLEFALPSSGGRGSFEARIVPLDEKEVAVIIRDITESKRMEHEIRLSEDRYRAIFETTGSATAILEEDGRISLANAEFKATFGHWQPDAGIYWTDLLIEPDRERMHRYHQDLLAHPKKARKEYELHCLHRDGSTRDMIMVIDLVPGTRRCVLSLLDITERKQAVMQIRAQLREKEVLIKEIHHRVKNNLQIISSLLTLQSHVSHDPAVAEVFLECQNRIRSLSLIHESLYQAKDLGRIDFTGYLKRLAGSLLGSYGVGPDRIRYRICAENIFLNIDTATPCGLIISELISNCIKHAFPAGMQGTISIEMADDGGGAFCLNISDTGIGFPEDLDFRKTESLGMQLVCSLVGQLNGTIELLRGHGTRFEIRFTELHYCGRGVV